MERTLFETIKARILNSEKFYIKDSIYLEEIHKKIAITPSNLYSASEIVIGHTGFDTVKKFGLIKIPINVKPDGLLLRLEHHLCGDEIIQAAYLGTNPEQLLFQRQTNKDYMGQNLLEKVFITTEPIYSSLLRL